MAVGLFMDSEMLPGRVTEKRLEKLGDVIGLISITAFGVLGSVENHSITERNSRNFLLWVRRGVKEGCLRGAQLFLFVDIRVAESAFAKGSSTSRKMSEMVLELCQLENWKVICIYPTYPPHRGYSSANS
jgi:hypothetical protein